MDVYSIIASGEIFTRDEGLTSDPEFQSRLIATTGCILRGKILSGASLHTNCRPVKTTSGLIGCHILISIFAHDAKSSIDGTIGYNCLSSIHTPNVDSTFDSSISLEIYITLGNVGNNSTISSENVISGKVEEITGSYNQRSVTTTIQQSLHINIFFTVTFDDKSVSNLR